MRNIRDCKSDRQTLGSASHFNIVTKAFTLGNFSLEEIADFYKQHTTATGQIFERAAIEKAFYYSNGQPWLVNTIAREIIVKILNNDFTRIITPELVHQAALNIILRRESHISNLLGRLKEYRVQKVIEPMIIGEQLDIDILDDDSQYCIDLGLIKAENGKILPANPIIGEIIIRTLTHNMQFQLTGKEFFRNSASKF